MGIVDMFTPEDKLEIKYSDLCEFMKEAAKNDLLENAIKAEVPNRYIRGMLSGKKEVEFAEYSPSWWFRSATPIAPPEIERKEILKIIKEENAKEEILSDYQIKWIEDTLKADHKIKKLKEANNQINEDLERIFKE